MSEHNVLTDDIAYPSTSRDHVVLLLHGLRSTPQEMSYLARYLARPRFSVFAPYLEGYGLGTPCTTAEDWREQVRAHYRQLRSRHEHVSVAGLCIGATLALALAAEEPDLLALSLLSVTLDYDGWTIPWYHWLLNLAYKTPLRDIYSLREKSPYGLKNAALRTRIAKGMAVKGNSEIGAASLSMHHIYEAKAIARYAIGSMASVHADCLLIHAVDDDVSTTANANQVHARIGSTFKRKVFLDDCYHIITMDNERDLVARETHWFLDEAQRRREAS